MKAKRIITTIALSVLLFAGSAAAQTTTATGTIPDAPNTGSGGSAPANILLLTGSLAVTLGGLATLLRRRTH